MSSSAFRTTRSIKEELPRLLRWHELSMNKFAKKLRVSAAHVARTVKPDHPDSFSGDLAARAAKFFDLPEDYFPEFRRDFLLDTVRSDPELCDELYDTAARLLADRHGRDEEETEMLSYRGIS